jgi:hypothetical protein
MADRWGQVVRKRWAMVGQRPTGQERLFRPSRPQPVPRSDRPSGPSGCFQAIRGGARSREVDGGPNTQPRERQLADRNSTFLRDVLRIFQPFMSYPGIVRMQIAEFGELLLVVLQITTSSNRTKPSASCEDRIAGVPYTSHWWRFRANPARTRRPLCKCDRFAGRIRNDISVCHRWKGYFRPLLERE